MCALFDEDTNWWNRNLVEGIFLEEEVTKICGMAISPNKQADQLVWVGNKNGEYFVKSTYHLAKCRMEMERGSSSKQPGDVSLWKAIWKIRATRAVTMFIWKACSDILPTKDNLFKRGISNDSMCPICGSVPETVGHAIWTCPATKDVLINNVKGKEMPKRRRCPHQGI